MQTINERALLRAREWLGTPYRHQCSVREFGCDCLGLVRGIYRDLHGFEPVAPPPYTPDWAEAKAEETLFEAASQHLVPLQLEQAEPGCVLLFRARPDTPMKHAGIMSAPNRMIHAYWGRAVCETSLGNWWLERLSAVFRFPEHPLQSMGSA